jgi:PAS domain S-box-containing protein
VTAPLRILLLEDDPTDAVLIQELLESNSIACEVTRAETRAEYVSGLEDPAINLVLADYKLPSFDGLSALKLALSKRPGLPFIFVSGTLGEEVAIEALKIGATDYVLKSRLSRLGLSVKRALREATDRAQHRGVEEALRRSEMYLAEAQRLSHTGTCVFNATTLLYHYWSNECYRIWGFDPLQGLPSRETVWQRIHPDDRDRVSEGVQEALRQKRDYAGEFKIVLPDGTLKYLAASMHHLFSAGGEIVEVIGTHIDVTERKRAEHQRERLRQLEGDLARINRVSTMGELAASLAHEIKQPIACIAADATAVSSWLRRDPPEIAEACESTSHIINSATRVARIVDRNRALYSRETKQRELIDLNEIIREMVALLYDTAHRHSISIHDQLDPTLPETSADRVQLQQVLINLMLNGIEAMKGEGGELSVASMRSQDGKLLVVVTDSGVGLLEAGPERIFDAFFTTKPDGTGMGLSISRRIIEAHGGRLWADNNTGRGATFQFTLPIEPVAYCHDRGTNRFIPKIPP